jgi:hypothetical protein
MNFYTLADGGVVGDPRELNEVNALLRQPQNNWWFVLSKQEQATFLSRDSQNGGPLLLRDILQLFTNHRFVRNLDRCRGMALNKMYLQRNITLEGGQIVENGASMIVRDAGVELHRENDGVVYASARTVVEREGDIRYNPGTDVVISRGVEVQEDGDRVRVVPSVVPVYGDEVLHRVGDRRVALSKALKLEEVDDTFRVGIDDEVYNDVRENVVNNKLLLRGDVELVDGSWNVMYLVSACCMAFMCCGLVLASLAGSLYFAWDDEVIWAIFLVLLSGCLCFSCVLIVIVNLFHSWTPPVKYNAGEQIDKLAAACRCPRELAAKAMISSMSSGTSPKDVHVMARTLQKFMQQEKSKREDSNFDDYGDEQINALAMDVAVTVLVAHREHNAILQDVYENEKSRRRFGRIRDAIFGGGAASLFSSK